MSNEDAVVQTMRQEEVGMAIEWAALEGWNPGQRDAECFFAADPEGFLLAALNGRPIGCCSAVVYDETFGFFGLFIVHPDFRGQGHGLALTRASLERFGDRSVGLDGVVAMQHKYRRFGFELAHRNVRYQGTAAGRMHECAVPLTEVGWTELLAYDRRCFPAAREAFLKTWVDQPAGAALGYVSDRRLAGYGVLRPCHTGYKIGPLFANDEGIAERLFASLSATVAGQTIFLDPPEVNRQAIALAERAGMTVVFETARMYRNGRPEIPLQQVFGITSFELG